MLLKSASFYLIYVLVYFKPSLDISVLLELFESCLQEIILKNPSAFVIIGGDFNCRVGNLNPSSEEICHDSYLSELRESLDSVVNKKGKMLVEFMEERSLILLNGRLPSDTPGNFTYISSLGKSVIDLVWCNLPSINYIQNLNVADHIVVSDHLPVCVDLILPTPKSCPNPQIITDPIKSVTTNSIKWMSELGPVFTQKMQNSDKICLDFEYCSVDHMNTILTQTISNTAKSIAMFRKQTHYINKFITNNKKWFDKECMVLKRETGKLYRYYRKKRQDKYLNLFLEKKSLFKKLIKIKEKEYQISICNNLTNCSNSAQFWNTVKSLYPKKDHTCPIKLSEWTRYLKSITKPSLVQTSSFLDVGHPILDIHVTSNEIQSSLSKCRPNKSPGSDEISYEFYKNLPQNWLLYMQVMYNKILERETVPGSWADIILTMIHKKDDKLDPSNYRSIALVNCVAKLFTHILLSRIERWELECGIVPESQAGFRSGRGCLDHVFTLSCLNQIQLGLRKRKAFILFVDFKSAFDSLSHDLLWHKLFSLGLSGKIIRILQNLYSKASVRIKIRGEYSESISLGDGVLQGETLSPVIFKLFISDIEKFFKSRGVGGICMNANCEILSLQFADDFAIIADSYQDLIHKINILEDYCSENKLTVNISKSKILKLGKKNQKLKFYYKKERLESVPSYMYLGIPFSSSCLFPLAVEYSLSKASTAVGSVMHILGKSKTNSWQTRMKLFQSIVKTSLLYCAPVWSLNYLDHVERAQNKFFKRLLSLSRSTPGFMIRLETGSLPIAYHVLKTTLSWIHKIENMADDRYPKACLNQLIYYDSRAINIKKFNWFTQIKNIINRVDLTNIGDFPTCLKNKGAIKEILGKFRNYFFEQDIKSLQESKYSNTLFLINNNPTFTIAPYLELQLTQNRLNVVSQLRLSGKYIIKITVSGISHIINPQNVCTICNLIEPEDLPHILFKCPMYNFVRPSIFNIQSNENVNDKLKNILTPSNTKDVHTLYMFSNSALKIRAFIINE